MVHAGEIVACRWARLACKRHLDDLERSTHPGFAFRFDLEAAGKICFWLEQMPHVEGGPWPSPTITLELWQRFVYGSIYGWVQKSDGLRRFTKAYISVPRKNAKTTALAGIGHFALRLDGEHGAQVYNGANKLEQAMLLFDPAKKMAEFAPKIFGRLGIVKQGGKALWHHASNSRWRPVSKNPGDGGGAHLFIQDEFHEAKTPVMTDAIEQGQGARRQPLSIKITTAGDNIGGPCYSYELQIQKILEGTITRDNTFGIVYTIDLQEYIDPFGNKCPPDDWTSVAAAKKANPNWGVSVIERTFLDELLEAIQDPAKQNVFKTKRLNIWCNAAIGYFNLQDWVECFLKDLHVDGFRSWPCLLGLDLASKLDLCTSAKVFRIPNAFDPDEEELAHYYVFWRSYLPTSETRKTNNSHYREWVAAGWLTETEGNITDYRRIYADLVADVAGFDVREVCFDQRESGLLIQDLVEETNVSIFEVPQNVAVLSEPLKWLKALMVDRRIHHAGDPIGSWCVSNVVVTPDRNQNVFPFSAKDELKIDLVSALLNALVRARQVLPEPPSIPFEVEVWS
jgi:phage terminase large subunit-like protein